MSKMVGSIVPEYDPSYKYCGFCGRNLEEQIEPGSPKFDRQTGETRERKIIICPAYGRGNSWHDKWWEI